jgi:hypothetical protein
LIVVVVVVSKTQHKYYEMHLLVGRLLTSLYYSRVSIVKTTFLLGAGSSLPANLPDMPMMTKLFFEHLDTSNELSHSLRTKIRALKTITEDHFRERKDLESFMTLVKRLTEAENDADLLLNKYPKLKKIALGELVVINDYASLH